jgi:deoxycytidylate deaminase
MSESGVVNIRGKEYQTVAKRIADFRSEFGDYSIITDVQSNADVVVVKCVIQDTSGRTISTGYAEEVRDSTNINKTSALENCETSAVGRALAFFGFGGSEIASANEVNGAIVAGAKKEVVDYMAKYAECLRKNLDIIAEVKSLLGDDDLFGAAQQWFELSEDEQRMLYLAPSKGGILTTEERAKMKTPEFSRVEK